MRIMSTGNVNLDILLDQINTDRLAGTDASILQIMNRYPSLSWKQAEEIYKLVSTAYADKSSIEASLIATVPPSFSIKAKSTKINKNNTIPITNIRCELLSVSIKS